MTVPTGEPGEPSVFNEDDLIKNAKLTLTVTFRGPSAVKVATYLRMNQRRGGDYLREVVETDLKLRLGK